MNWQRLELNKTRKLMTNMFQHRTKLELKAPLPPSTWILHEKLESLWLDPLVLTTVLAQIHNLSGWGHYMMLKNSCETHQFVVVSISYIRYLFSRIGNMVVHVWPRNLKCIQIVVLVNGLIEAGYNEFDPIEQVLHFSNPWIKLKVRRCWNGRKTLDTAGFLRKYYFALMCWRSALFKRFARLYPHSFQFHGLNK